MAHELERADQLGIACVVTHPGAFTTSSEEQGLQRVIQALDEIHRRLPRGKAVCLLETTAGQGSSLGWRFEHLATILQASASPKRLGVCIDTCHLFAAGFPLAPRKEYLATLRTFDQVIGLDQIRAIHLNDSKKGLGSRVDRHAHIGRGEMGLDAFRNILNDRRFRQIPMYLETPKGVENGEDLDVMNLRVLRSLVEK
jgi:deoxyribonuclease-4